MHLSIYNQTLKIHLHAHTSVCSIHASATLRTLKSLGHLLCKDLSKQHCSLWCNRSSAVSHPPSHPVFRSNDSHPFKTNKNLGCTKYRHLPKHKHMYTCFEGYSPLSALVWDSLICVLTGLRQNNGFLN